MSYDERKKDYIIGYIKEHKDRILLDVPKGKKAVYKQLAEKRGKSLTGLIVELLENELKRDN